MTYYYASYPPADLERNPFMVLLGNELRKKGWDSKTFTFKIVNLVKYRREVSILYFHWPESIWRSSSILITLIKAFVFLIRLATAKLLGYRIVWSAHNSWPHEFLLKGVEQIMRIFLIKNCDLVIGHSLNSAEELNEYFGVKPKKYQLALHGHYDNVYLPEGRLTRELLNIDSEKKIFLLLAKTRSRNEDDFFINEWMNWDSHKSILIISGTLSVGSKEKVKNLKNIFFIEGFRSRGEMADLFVLANIIVLPYRKITTSGMFFMAVTFGKPILAPDIPFFKLHMAKNGGVLYRLNQNDLRNEFNKACDVNFDIGAILRQKEIYSWTHSGSAIGKIFTGLLC